MRLYSFMQGTDKMPVVTSRIQASAARITMDVRSDPVGSFAHSVRDPTLSAPPFLEIDAPSFESTLVALDRLLSIVDRSCVDYLSPTTRWLNLYMKRFFRPAAHWRRLFATKPTLVLLLYPGQVPTLAPPRLHLPPQSNDNSGHLSGLHDRLSLALTAGVRSTSCL